MIHSLKLLHIQGNYHHLTIEEPGAFILKTCQRAIVLKTTPFTADLKLNGEYYEGEMAYQFLLETICGLKSKLLGESEVVSQFKEAYQAYIKEDIRSSVTLRVLEKLFKDAKEIRTQYLVRIGQQSYAGISRRIVEKSHKSGNVLILGSGQLARDVIKLFKKRYNIFISARNQTKLSELVSEFGELDIQTVPWMDHKNYQGYTSIINTIGTEDILFGHDFFAARTNNLFVDLGSPSAIETSHDKNHGVYRLNDVFSFGADLDKEKHEKVANAKNAITAVVKKRSSTLGHSYPFSWEQLQFSY